MRFTKTPSLPSSLCFRSSIISSCSNHTSPLEPDPWPLKLTHFQTLPDLPLTSFAGVACAVPWRLLTPVSILPLTSELQFLQLHLLSSMVIYSVTGFYLSSMLFGSPCPWRWGGWGFSCTCLPVPSSLASGMAGHIFSLALSSLVWQGWVYKVGGPSCNHSAWSSLEKLQSLRQSTLTITGSSCPRTHFRELSATEMSVLTVHCQDPMEAGTWNYF